MEVHNRYLVLLLYSPMQNQHQSQIHNHPSEFHEWWKASTKRFKNQTLNLFLNQTLCSRHISKSINLRILLRAVANHEWTRFICHYYNHQLPVWASTWLQTNKIQLNNTETLHRHRKISDAAKHTNNAQTNQQQSPFNDELHVEKTGPVHARILHLIIHNYHGVLQICSSCWQNQRQQTANCRSADKRMLTHHSILHTTIFFRLHW